MLLCSFRFIYLGNGMGWDGPFSAHFKFLTILIFEVDVKKGRILLGNLDSNISMLVARNLLVIEWKVSYRMLYKIV